MPPELITLGLSMPPVVSAGVSTVTLIVLFFLGRLVLGRMNSQGATVQQNFTKQRETLDAIQTQTAETNGRVIALEVWSADHKNLDDERHAVQLERHAENKVKFEELRHNQERLLHMYETNKRGFDARHTEGESQ